MIKKPLKQLFEAMYHGKYDFLDFVEGNIKENFDIFTIDDRKICRPNKKLKKYHSFLNLFLFENFRINPSVVYSYRKGVNVFDAVSQHSASKHFFQTDIAKFFPSIDADLIRKTLSENLDVVQVIDANDYVDRIVDLVTVDNSLPIGFATSPPISNACLFVFDNMLHDYCMSKNLVYTRYADDLIISTKNRDELEGIADQVEQRLFDAFAQKKMALHQGKTKFTHVGAKVKLLGMVILPNGTVSVDMKFKKQIEVILHFYITDRTKFLALVDSDLNAGMEKISGQLGYINTVDKNYLNKLRKKYGATVVDMFLHYSPTK
ncbi:RNA-directed DNA polymerase [Oxalobacteraceae bacterium GrIS 2.11]